MTPPREHAGPRDPSSAEKHRISLRPTNSRVQVRFGEVVLAESDRPTLLVEQGFPARWYLPREDVRLDLLRPTGTTTVCPFKGRATYWSFEPAGPAGADVAWSYEDPVTSMAALEGLVCFYADRAATTVDGVMVTRRG